MGKRIRWLKALFGITTEPNSGHRKHKIPSCICLSRRGFSNSPPESPEVVPVYNEEHSRHAIAVATATAVAADAAVAAAQAAVAFVRITSQSHVTNNNVAGDRENSAAIKIQSLFRGYLSRKALKALKSLVKLQAVVRGYLVRKEAVKTLQGMEALFRARSSFTANKFRLQDEKFHSTRSTRAGEGRNRRNSCSFQFQIPNDGKPNMVGLKEPNPTLTRANTWAWATDQTPSSLFISTRHLSLSGSSNIHVFEPQISTTHNTPLIASPYGPDTYGSIYDGFSKDDSYASHPGYMANTKSFRAKVRSHSAPKQRPESGLGLGLGLGPGVKKNVGGNEVECGLKMEKTNKSPLMVKNSFKNYVMDWKVLRRST